MKKIYLFLLLILKLSCFATAAANFDYPNFKDNPLLTDRMRFMMTVHLIPLDHPMKSVLDSIFSQSRVLESEKTLIDAGFEIIAGPMTHSYMIVARHPAVPGYVFKMYLDSEVRCREGTPHWEWLVRRCVGAQGIRHVIRTQNIHHFLVPDKWLYPLPVYPYSNSLHPQVVVLIETDMEVESLKVTKKMWKTAITRKHLDELYLILKEGYGGNDVLHLNINVPFTKHGKFAFTDTEFSRTSHPKLKRVKEYLSKEMQSYWSSLIR